MPKKQAWQRLSSEVKYENPWIKVQEDQVINPAGGKGIYGKVHYKNIAIGIIPIDGEGNTWLVGQHRYPLDMYSWEIPEGGGPEGEDNVESARRELKEETGLAAELWQEVLTMHLSNSVSDEVAHIFVATQLTQGATAFEATEDLAIKKLPIKEAIQMVMDGEITDSMSVAGLLKVDKMMRAGILEV
jgi:8-oxo-dGTP pyrophosphatase MutT (NUDIX family)